MKNITKTPSRSSRQPSIKPPARKPSTVKAHPELTLIDQIRRSSSRRNPLIPLGIGDDCAILRPPHGHELLVTTDFSLEGVHFRRDTHPPEAVGHRCIARGISDIASMGASPIAAFLSLALPAGFSSSASGRAWISRFFKGLHALADLHRITLAGGDLAQSPSPHIFADITLFGSAPYGESLRRSTARPGDLLYVTGSLGGSAAELSSLLSPLRPRRSSEASHPHLFPQPSIRIAKLLRTKHLASAAIDVSDGLSTDLSHLCRASHVRAILSAPAIPIHPLAALQPADALQLALHGGEDYELLFSAPPSARIPRSVGGVRITAIGHLAPVNPRHPLITLESPGSPPTELLAQGWEHFRTPQGVKSPVSA